MRTLTSRSRSGAYDAYLVSDAWRARRRAWYTAWLTQCGTPPACMVCSREWSLRSRHLHHLTYERLGDEGDEDLVPLCPRDHRQLHRVLEASAGWRRLGRRQASAGIISLLRHDYLATRAGGELGKGGS